MLAELVQRDLERQQMQQAENSVFSQEGYPVVGASASAHSGLAPALSSDVIRSDDRPSSESHASGRVTEGVRKNAQLPPAPWREYSHHDSRSSWGRSDASSSYRGRSSWNQSDRSSDGQYNPNDDRWRQPKRSRYGYTPPATQSSDDPRQYITCKHWLAGYCNRSWCKFRHAHQ